MATHRFIFTAKDSILRHCNPYRVTDDCIHWNGIALNRYANVRVNGKNIRAHRAVYEMFNGPISLHLIVCHTCNNKSCVNPRHLFAGTVQDNVIHYRKTIGPTRIQIMFGKH